MSDNYVRCNYLYREQQTFLNELASKYGFYVYRPDYHAAPRDANTVLLYTMEDEKHNRKVDTQPIRYSRSEAEDRRKYGFVIGDEFVYRDAFFTTENTDINGMFDMNFMNFGTIRLWEKHWRERLEGAVLSALVTKKRNDYVRKYGSFWNIREGDNVYNDLNRDEIRAFFLKHGSAYMGRINFHGEERDAVIKGSKSVYVPYVGQDVFNFDCTFVVPCNDAELESMIRSWVKLERLPSDMKLLDRIMERIDGLAGIHLVWY